MISRKRKTNVQVLESILKHLAVEADKVELSSTPEPLSKDVSSMVDKVLPQRVKAKGIKKNELISTKRLLTQ